MSDSDPDARAIRQTVHESIVAVKKQINLLGQRILYSQRRVHDLQTKQQKGPTYKESKRD
jgi:hypothetical protein